MEMCIFIFQECLKLAHYDSIYLMIVGVAKHFLLMFR